jgi:hypothetical protein
MLRIKLFAVAIFALFGVLYFGYGGWESMAKTAPAGNSITTPTGVQGSMGDYANKVGIYWDTMKGATLYRVFRNTTNEPVTATDVGTSAGNYFFDTSAAVQQQYYYWVRAENGEASAA